MIELSLFLLALAAFVLLAILLRHRQRDAEAHAARTLARLRRNQTTLSDRTAEVGHEVATLYGGAARLPAHS